MRFTIVAQQAYLLIIWTVLSLVFLFAMDVQQSDLLMNMDIVN